MYNLRARSRATLPGSVPAQGRGSHARLTPTTQPASQVTASQSLDLFEEVSTVLETEVIAQSSNFSDVEDNLSISSSNVVPIKSSVITENQDFTTQDFTMW